MKTLDVALTLSRMGFSIIPVHTKVDGLNIDIGKFHLQSALEEQITSWFTRSPDAKIGILTGKKNGIVVLEVYSEHPHDLLNQKEIEITWQKKTVADRSGFERTGSYPLVRIPSLQLAYLQPAWLLGEESFK